MAKEMKRGQVTIWVIVAIFIVAGIILLFLIRIKPISPIGSNNNLDPSTFIGTCAKKYTEEALDRMLPQGGFLEPENYVMYNNKKIEYLCIRDGYYKSCINQHPLLIGEIKNELENYLDLKMSECFIKLKEEYEKRNYNVDLGDMNIKVEFVSRKVFVEIKREARFSKDENILQFNDFDTEILYPVSDLSNLAIEIANQEAKYCYFEYVGYMILYPNIDIRKTSMSDSTKIYTITDKKSEKTMNIAVRSCAIPPGI